MAKTTTTTTFKDGRRLVSQYTTDDGDKVIISRLGSQSITEVIPKIDEKAEAAFVEKTTATPIGQISRAQRMKDMINQKLERNVIKQTLIDEGYDVKNFASEWFRLNK